MPSPGQFCSLCTGFNVLLACFITGKEARDECVIIMDEIEGNA